MRRHERGGQRLTLMGTGRWQQLLQRQQQQQQRQQRQQGQRARDGRRTRRLQPEASRGSALERWEVLGTRAVAALLAVVAALLPAAAALAAAQRSAPPSQSTWAVAR